MKIKEITVKREGVLGTKEYENDKPGSFWTAVMEGKEQTFKGAKDCYYEIKNFLIDDFEKDRQRARVHKVKEQLKHIKFGDIYSKDLELHVRASSVEAHAFPLPPHLDSMALVQYAARGNIIHELSNIFVTGGSVKEWKDPKDIPKLATDLNLLRNGGLQLDYRACSHIAFFDKYQDDIGFESETFLIKHIVRDDASLTCGEIDFIAPFQEKLSVIDFKTGAFDKCWPRMAFYFKHCGLPVEQMAVFPLKPTDNKQGYCKPVIVDNKKKIDEYYEAFMVQREKLRETFNV